MMIQKQIFFFFFPRPQRSRKTPLVFTLLPGNSLSLSIPAFFLHICARTPLALSCLALLRCEAGLKSLRNLWHFKKSHLPSVSCSFFQHFLGAQTSPKALRDKGQILICLVPQLIADTCAKWGKRTRITPVTRCSAPVVTRAGVFGQQTKQQSSWSWGRTTNAARVTMCKETQEQEVRA